MGMGDYANMENKLTVIEIMELVKRYNLTDWKIEGARTGKTICTNYYRSNIYNSPLYFHKEVACLATEIYSTKRKDEIQNTVKSRLVISISGE